MSTSAWTPVDPSASKWTPVAPSNAAPQQPASLSDAVKLGWDTAAGDVKDAVSAPHAIFNAGAQYVKQKLAEMQQENLEAAAAGKPLPHNYLGMALIGMGHDLLKMGSGVTSAPGAAAAAGMVVAPEVAGPALATLGAAQMLSHAGGAARLNPQDLQDFLFGGAGVAGGVGALEGAPGPVSGRLINSGRELLGMRLPPAEIDETPAAAEYQPALDVSDRDVIQHAANEGVQLTPAQAAGTPLAKLVQAEGERSIFGSNALVREMTKNQAAHLQAVGDFADRLDPHQLGVTDETAGEAIKANAQAALSVARENADYAYQEAADRQGDIAGNLRPLEKFADEKLNVRQPHAAVARPEYQAPAVRAALNDIANAPDRVGDHPSVQSMRNLRTEFWEKANDYSGNIPDSARALYKQAAKIVDDRIMAAAKGTSFEEKFRDASAQWKALQEKYNTPGEPLYRILQQPDPARVTQSLISRQSVRDIQTLKTEDMQGALEALRRRVVADVAKSNFRVNAGGLGGFSDGFLKELFGPQDLRELYVKSEIARRMRLEINPSGTSNVLLGNEQLVNPVGKTAWVPLAAAKASFPRDPLAYLPTGEIPKLDLSATLPGSAAAQGYRRLRAEP